MPSWLRKTSSGNSSLLVELFVVVEGRGQSERAAVPLGSQATALTFDVSAIACTSRAKDGRFYGDTNDMMGGGMRETEDARRSWDQSKARIKVMKGAKIHTYSYCRVAFLTMLIIRSTMAEQQEQEYSPSDFVYGPMIGEGRFGSVVYAHIANDSSREKHHGHGYAIKMIPKSEIIRHNLLQSVMTEKRILSETLTNNQDDDESSTESMIPKLFCCFHDHSYLYFVMELCNGGTMVDLFDHCTKLRQDKSRNDDISNSPFMDETWVTYYAAQLVRVLEYIHKRGVIHRDISPRNILLTSSGNMKLCDFGSAVIIETTSSEQDDRIDNDFVGTAGLVAPETIRGDFNKSILHRRELLPAVDLWSLGCLIYQMSIGVSPFHADNDQGAFQRVLDFANQKCSLDFPSYVDVDAKDLISSLLAIDAAFRIGVSDGVVCAKDSQKQYETIRSHRFFAKGDLIDQQFWDRLETNAIHPPYRPCEQQWMTQLRQSGWKMKRIQDIYFEL